MATRAPKHKTSLTTIQAGVKQSANRMVAALSFSQHPFMTVNTTCCPRVSRQNVVLRRFLEASVGLVANASGPGKERGGGQRCRLSCSTTGGRDHTKGLSTTE